MAAAKVHVLVGVGSRGGQDVTMACAAGLLKFQQMLACGHVPDVPDGAHLDFVTDPLAEPWPSAPGPVVVIDAAVGFDAATIARALAPDKRDVVTVGACPMPGIDWAAVAAAPRAREPASNRGLTFNVDLAPPPPAESSAAAAGAAASERRVTAVRSWDLVVLPAPTGAGHRTVGDACAAALAAGRVVADLREPCTRLAPLDYAGCVGLRRVLR